MIVNNNVRTLLTAGSSIRLLALANGEICIIIIINIISWVYHFVVRFLMAIKRLWWWRRRWRQRGRRRRRRRLLVAAAAAAIVSVVVAVENNHRLLDLVACESI